MIFSYFSIGGWNVGMFNWVCALSLGSSILLTIWIECSNLILDGFLLLLSGSVSFLRSLSTAYATFRFMDFMTFSNDDLLSLSTFRWRWNSTFHTEISFCSDSTGMHCNGAMLTKGRVAREMIGTIETKRGDGELHIRALCSKQEKSRKNENFWGCKKLIWLCEYLAY